MYAHRYVNVYIKYLQHYMPYMHNIAQLYILNHLNRCTSVSQKNTQAQNAWFHDDTHQFKHEFHTVMFSISVFIPP